MIKEFILFDEMLHYPPLLDEFHSEFQALYRRLATRLTEGQVILPILDENRLPASWPILLAHKNPVIRLYAMNVLLTFEAQPLPVFWHYPSNNAAKQNSVNDRLARIVWQSLCQRWRQRDINRTTSTTFVNNDDDDNNNNPAATATSTYNATTRLSESNFNLNHWRPENCLSAVPMVILQAMLQIYARTPSQSIAQLMLTLIRWVSFDIVLEWLETSLLHMDSKMQQILFAMLIGYFSVLQRGGTKTTRERLIELLQILMVRLRNEPAPTGMLVNQLITVAGQFILRSSSSATGTAANNSFIANSTTNSTTTSTATSTLTSCANSIADALATSDNGININDNDHPVEATVVPRRRSSDASSSSSNNYSIYLVEAATPSDSSPSLMSEPRRKRSPSVASSASDEASQYSSSQHTASFSSARSKDDDNDNDDNDKDGDDGFNSARKSYKTRKTDENDQKINANPPTAYQQTSLINSKKLTRRLSVVSSNSASSATSNERSDDDGMRNADTEPKQNGIAKGRRKRRKSSSAGLTGLLADSKASLVAPHSLISNYSALPPPPVNSEEQQDHKNSIKILDLVQVNREAASNERGKKLFTGKPPLLMPLANVSPQQDLTMKILECDWSLIDHANSSTQSSLLESVPQTIPSTFQSVQDYQKVFEPLAIAEAWAQIVKAKEELQLNSGGADHRILQMELVGVCANSSCHDISFRLPPVADNLSAADHIDQYDLILIGSANLSRDDFINGKDPARFLAKIIEIRRGSSISRSSSNCSMSSSSISRNSNNNNNNNLATLTARIVLGKQRLALFSQFRTGSGWMAVNLCNLSTIQRELAAAKSIGQLTLGPAILRGRISEQKVVGADESKLDRLRQVFSLNRSQVLATWQACSQPSGFVLIQGPPGTGLMLSTTTTMTGVKSTVSNNCRLLICAPSNAACDELTMRCRRTLIDQHGQRIRPSMLRFGTNEGVGEDCRALSIDQLVEAALLSDPDLTVMFSSLSFNNQSVLQSSSASTTVAAPAEQQLREWRKLRAKLEPLTRLLQSSSDQQTIAKIERDIRELSMKCQDLAEVLIKQAGRREISRRLMETARLKHRHRILNETQLVFCTLSMSGHESLSKEILKPFDCVIIDEACQAVELSALIPLRFGSSKCILVGDPNQLPPTVLARDGLAYEQSLFERLQRSNPPNSVFLLSVQYRMHPEIARFPSVRFYNRLLTDGPKQQELCRAAWHKSNYPVYAFFDVSTGRESNSTNFSTSTSLSAMGQRRTGSGGGSLYNQDEIDAIISVLTQFFKDNPLVPADNVATITPYREQKYRLELALKSGNYRSQASCIDNIGVIGEKLRAVQVRTVDGFQGQEKDVILFSCVRANRERSIGFLSDVRRLNVALTRAKKSLWLFGNQQALSGNSFWRSLIEDAKSRRLLIPIEEHLKSISNFPSSIATAATE